MNYLSVENISKAYGARTLFSDISFGISEGQKVALVARNGSGKTTLLRILKGEETPDKGNISFRKGIRIGYLSQDPDLTPGTTVLQSVLLADSPASRAIQDYEEAMENPDDADKFQKAFEDMDRHQAWDYEASVKQILGKLGLDHFQQKVENLSGGQIKRIALARTLISAPDLLILDEPTNHLDVEMIEWLEEYLNQSSITLFMVTHDRYFLENICDSIFEMEDGKLFQHPGNFSDFLRRKAEREEVEAVNVGKAGNLMRKELEWIRRQPKARGTKSKARIEAFGDLKEKASKQRKEEKMELEVKMTRMGSKILELHRLRKSYGEKKILDGFDYTFKKGERIGIVGKNGVGKTTFLRLITGQEEPDGGKIVTGETIKYGYYSQSGLELDEDKRVIEVVKEIAEFIPVGRKGKQISASQMLDRFLFEGDRQYTYVSKLSGGERRRLHLLCVLMENPNFLILDEPTNDLDILSLNVLEDFLMDFGGCLLVVTHDRYFMNKLTDHLFVFEGEGQVRDFPGNYTEYRDDLDRREKLEKARNTSAPVKTESKKADPGAKTKLTYGEKIELEKLEKELKELEKRKAEITAGFESGELAADEIDKLSKELNELLEKLEEKEMRWLELSEFESGS